MHTDRIYRLATFLLLTLAFAACDEQPEVTDEQTPAANASNKADGGADKPEPIESTQRHRLGSCPASLAFTPTDTVTGVQDSRSPKTLIQVERDGKTFSIQASCTGAPNLNLKAHINKIVERIEQKHAGTVGEPVQISADELSGWQFDVQKGDKLSKAHFFHHADQSLVYMAVSGSQGVDAFTAKMLQELEWQDGKTQTSERAKE